MWRDDLVVSTFLPPAILRLVESVDVQLDGDQPHRGRRHGILHGVRIPQVLSDVVSIRLIKALPEVLIVASYGAFDSSGVLTLE